LYTIPVSDDNAGMITPDKFIRLPRSQRLRKAAKLAGDAERRLCSSGTLPPEEAGYIGKIAELLSEDTDFSVAVREAFKTAGLNLTATGMDIKIIRRALNGIYRLILAETGRYPSDWDFIDASGSLDPLQRRPFPGMQVYLEDIRSPFNVGAMFRAAESFGAEKIWLSPLCADPGHKRARRTAMGCVDVLPWERLSVDPFTAEAGITPFRSCPFFTMESGGIPLADFPFPSHGVLVAGSEELGVSPGGLTAADASLGRVTIPSYGAKGSLNVSVAFGIVMQAWAARLAGH
jgi:TrmH family RNA methyltransferase